MKELLVPVGNLEVLKVAVLNGCDAVYLGGKKFGARAFANNFSNDELIEAVNFCHLYGVKIYVTVNTLTYESEINDVMEYLTFLNEINVDAVIVQDIGIISNIRKTLPELEVHASTQVHTTNEETVKYLESLGVTRVVFARETSCNDIANMKLNVEKEVFIHGALCVSYSGQCLMSSLLANRSGNRGECAGLCRLPYKLKEDDKLIDTDGDYLISMKDLNSSYNFIDILESDIYSLKIEGRMKSPEYVGCVTRLYRDLLDKYYNHEEVIVNKEIINDLKTIYNREFTKGFLFNEEVKNIVNIKNPNHIGTPLGKVIKIDNKYIYIELIDDINQGDGIRFLGSFDGGIVNFLYNEKGLLENSDNIGNIIMVDNKFKCRVGDMVNKTSSILLTEKYTNNLERYVKINANFVAKNGYMKLSFDDGINEVSIISEEVFDAIKQPTTIEDIISKVKKLGNTPFKLNDIKVNLGNNLFINMSTINKMRQQLVDELIEKRCERKNIVINKVDEKNISHKCELNISCLVRNQEQFDTVIDKVDRVYVTDESLYNKYKDNDKVYFRTSRIGKKVNYKNLLVTELSNISSGDNRVLDYYLNITNHLSSNELNGNINTLSVELTDNEIDEICKWYDYKTNFEMIIYGTIELMLMKYCPINKLVNKDKVCKMCFNNKRYYLVDRNGLEFRIVTEYANHTTHLMNHKVIDKINNIDYYRSLGINNYRIELLDETKEEIEDILNNIKSFI